MGSGLAGLILEVAILGILEAMRFAIRRTTTSRGKDEIISSLQVSPTSWDTPDLSRFRGGHVLVVSGEFIWNAMEEIREPVTNGWFLVFVLATILATPITEPSTPPLDENGKLLWAPNNVRGIPSCAFQIILVLVPYCDHAVCDQRHARYTSYGRSRREC